MFDTPAQQAARNDLELDFQLGVKKKQQVEECIKKYARLYGDNEKNGNPDQNPDQDDLWYAIHVGLGQLLMLGGQYERSLVAYEASSRSIMPRPRW